MRYLIPFLILSACDGATPTDPVEGDTDTDTDTDADTDTDTDTDVDVPEDCPEPGRGLMEVTITGADPAIVSGDELSVAFFPSAGGPPSYFFTGSGADATSLPATLMDNDVPPGDYGMLSFCHDAGGDTLNSCTGSGDVLLILSETLRISADQVHTLDIDFDAETVSTPSTGAPDASCP